MLAYTGARVNEIYQLTSADIIVVDGVWCLKSTDEGEHQQVKTTNAILTVPLHSQLLGLGFLDFSNDRNGRLFPSLTKLRGRWNRKISRWFNDTYLQKIGVKKDRLPLKSFRNTVATKFRNGRVPETVAAEILGHSVGGITYGRYANRDQVEQLASAIETISYSIE